MKILLLAITFIGISVCSFAQDKFLGQTKDYIINSLSTCYISKNDSIGIEMLCDNIAWGFMFKKRALVCHKVILYMKDAAVESYIKIIEEAGYKEIEIGEEYQLDEYNIKIDDSDEFSNEGYTTVFIKKTK